MHRIEQAIKKSRTEHTQSEDDQNSLRLQNLLSDAQGLLPRKIGNGENVSTDYQDFPRAHQDAFKQVRHQFPAVEPHMSVNNYSVDNAENPLQLLAQVARASDPSVPPQQSYSVKQGVSHGQATRQALAADQELEAFFGPFRPRLDIGEDIDPISMGLVTNDETEMLFT